MYQKRSVNIPGWEMYLVDTNGIVYGKNGNPLKYSLNHHGYCIVNFYHNNIRKGFSIHTLVAKTFIPNTDLNKTQVNHIDGDKTNNHVSNLEWTTPKENVDHSISILGNNTIGANNGNAKNVIGYDKETEQIKYRFNSISDAARYFNNSNYRRISNIICSVLKGRKRSYRGCIWKYE